MGRYLGDFRRSQNVRFQWNSFNSSGASVTRSTNGTISVYKDGGTTQTTTGVTDTEDFDSLTGVHDVLIATTDSFYVPGSDYSVVLSAATIDGQTVNAVLAHFSIENRWAGERRAGTTSTHGAQSITLASETAPGLNFFAGWTVRIITGTGLDQERVCVSSTNADPPVLTMDRAWTVSLSGSVTYKAWPGVLATTAAEQTESVIAALSGQNGYEFDAETDTNALAVTTPTTSYSATLTRNAAVNPITKVT